MTWYIGCFINICGSISINLGTNVMKLGHNKRALSSAVEEHRKSIKTFREWQIGVTIFIIGNIANFLSFGFAAQSLLASLGTIQFVSNVGFAHFVLHERVTRRVVFATCLIVGGCIILVLFGSRQSDELTVKDLMDLYARTTYILYLAMLFSFVVVSYILYKQGKRHIRDFRPVSGSSQSKWTTFLPALYALFSAMLGSQSVLMAKTLSELLRTTLTGDMSALTSWFTYFILFCFLFSASFWATRLNKSLQLFPSLVIVPMMQINWTMWSIMSGGMYFKEFEGFSGLQYGMFIFGVMVVLVGVVLLSWNPANVRKTYDPMGEFSDLARTATLEHSDSQEAFSIDENGLSSHPNLLDPSARSSISQSQYAPTRAPIRNPLHNPLHGRRESSFKAYSNLAFDANVNPLTVKDWPGAPGGASMRQASMHVEVDLPHDPEEEGGAGSFGGTELTARDLFAYCEDLKIDSRVSLMEGLGIGLPNADGRAPYGSVFGLPSMPVVSAPAASALGLDTIHRPAGSHRSHSGSYASWMTGKEPERLPNSTSHVNTHYVGPASSLPGVTPSGTPDSAQIRQGDSERDDDIWTDKGDENEMHSVLWKQAEIAVTSPVRRSLCRDHKPNPLHSSLSLPVSSMPPRPNRTSSIDMSALSRHSTPAAEVHKAYKGSDAGSEAMLDVNLEDTGSALGSSFSSALSSSLTASLTASQEQPRKNVLPGPLHVTKPAFVSLDIANPEEKENTMTAWKHSAAAEVHTNPFDDPTLLSSVPPSAQVPTKSQLANAHPPQPLSTSILPNAKRRSKHTYEELEEEELESVSIEPQAWGGSMRSRGRSYMGPSVKSMIEEEEEEDETASIPASKLQQFFKSPMETGKEAVAAVFESAVVKRRLLEEEEVEEEKAVGVEDDLQSVPSTIQSVTSERGGGAPSDDLSASLE